MKFNSINEIIIDEIELFNETTSVDNSKHCEIETITKHISSFSKQNKRHS